MLSACLIQDNKTLFGYVKRKKCFFFFFALLVCGLYVHVFVMNKKGNCLLYGAIFFVSFFSIFCFSVKMQTKRSLRVLNFEK